MPGTYWDHPASISNNVWKQTTFFHDRLILKSLGYNVFESWSPMCLSSHLFPLQPLPCCCHSHIPHQIPILCPSPAFQLPAWCLHHLSALFPPAILSFPGKGSIYSNVSTSLELCVCMQSFGYQEWKGKHFVHYVLCKPAKGNNLEMPCWSTRIYCNLPNVSEGRNSNSLMLQSPLCWKTIHSFTDSKMSGMQREWSRIQAKVKC